jgi:hypothetical protein
LDENRDSTQSAQSGAQNPQRSFPDSPGVQRRFFSALLQMLSHPDAIG